MMSDESKPSVLKKVLKPFSATDGTSLASSSSSSSSRTRQLEPYSRRDELVASPTSMSRPLPHSAHGEPSATLVSPGQTSTSYFPSGASTSMQPVHTTHGAPVPRAAQATSNRASSTEHTYPPTVFHRPTELVSAMSSTVSSWTVAQVPSWLRQSRLFTSGGTHNTGVTEVLSTAQHAKEHEPAQEMGFSILESHDISHDIDPQAATKFRTYFALDDKEALLGCTSFPAIATSVLSALFIADFPGFLFRVLPASGRIYISTNYFCFRSNSPLTRTRVRARACPKSLSLV